MIVDTSALLAIVFQESGYEDVLDRMLTYAVARLSGEPLLFVGEDFLKTDLESA